MPMLAISASILPIILGTCAFFALDSIVIMTGLFIHSTCYRSNCTDEQEESNSPTKETNSETVRIEVDDLSEKNEVLHKSSNNSKGVEAYDSFSKELVEDRTISSNSSNNEEEESRCGNTGRKKETIEVSGFSHELHNNLSKDHDSMDISKIPQPSNTPLNSFVQSQLFPSLPSLVNRSSPGSAYDSGYVSHILYSNSFVQPKLLPSINRGESADRSFNYSSVNDNSIVTERSLPPYPPVQHTIDTDQSLPSLPLYVKLRSALDERNQQNGVTNNFHYNTNNEGNENSLTSSQYSGTDSQSETDESGQVASNSTKGIPAEDYDIYFASFTTEATDSINTSYRSNSIVTKWSLPPYPQQFTHLNSMSSQGSLPNQLPSIATNKMNVGDVLEYKARYYYKNNDDSSIPASMFISGDSNYTSHKNNYVKQQKETPICYRSGYVQAYDVNRKYFDSTQQSNTVLGDNVNDCSFYISESERKDNHFFKEGNSSTTNEGVELDLKNSGPKGMPFSVNNNTTYLSNVSCTALNSVIRGVN